MCCIQCMGQIKPTFNTLSFIKSSRNQPATSDLSLALSGCKRLWNGANKYKSSYSIVKCKLSIRSFNTLRADVCYRVYTFMLLPHNQLYLLNILICEQYIFILWATKSNYFLDSKDGSVDNTLKHMYLIFFISCWISKYYSLATKLHY